MPPKSLDLQRDALRAACNGEDERGRETPFVVFYSGRWLYVSYNCCAMRSRDPRHRVAAGYNTCASGGSRLEPAPGGPGFHLSARRQTTPWAAQRPARASTGATALRGVLLLDMAHVARQASSLPMTRRVMCSAVTVAALSLAVLSSACGQEQIQEQIGEQPSSAELVRSAEQGDASAQVSLGAMYADGRGVPQDGAAAVAWYCRAAEQGNASAQVSLGALYSDGGSGVPQNLVEGHTWLNLAASRLTGEQREDAVTARDRVAERMTPADLSEAQHRAREWNAAHQVGVDIAPGTYGTSGLTAGMSLCSDARLSLYLEHALSVEDLTTGWLDVGLDDDGRNKLVPTISFRLANVSSEQVRTLQLNGVFRRCVVSDESLRFPPLPGYLGRDPYPAAGICDGEAQEWGNAYIRAVGLEPGASTRQFTLQSDLGYTGGEGPRQILQHRQFVDVKAELFVKQGAGQWVKLGEHQIERQLLTQ